MADYYQVKYHVDFSNSYSSDNIIDPKFINSKSSMLQRFFSAYKNLKKQHGDQWFQLNLISNWAWKSEDVLAKVIRTTGFLPDVFFEGTKRSTLGGIRELWRSHLVTDESTFKDFARRLRFHLNYFGRNQLQDSLNHKLCNAGLIVATPGQRTNPYVTLYLNFVMDGTNMFDRDAFKRTCKQEGLVNEGHRRNAISVIGIRSFMRCAERMEDETNSFICVAEHFDGRHVKYPSLWGTKVVPTVLSFIDTSRFRDKEYHILLDCHNSLAFFAGYVFDQKSGVNAYPMQKGVSTDLWKPTGESPSDAWQVVAEVLTKDPSAPHCAVAISLTSDVSLDVEKYISSQGLQVHTLLKLYPKGGVGQSCITSADHAIRLADLAISEIVRQKKKGSGVTHIFASAPNGFMFFLGRHRGPLGKVQLYEFDFEGERGGTYTPSITLPLSF